ncbi:MAG: DUF3015 family protein [Sulfurifustis sp.]
MAQQVKALRMALLGSVAGVLLGGCSVINTVTDGVSSTVEGVTKVTSSTSGDEKSAAFIENRFAAIRSEAARGEGEHLDSLAKLRGETDRVEFARFMKEHYDELFTGLEQPRELLTRIVRYRGRPAGSNAA